MNLICQSIKNILRCASAINLNFKHTLFVYNLVFKEHNKVGRGLTLLG